jgi:hypothetical protein
MEAVGYVQVRNDGAKDGYWPLGSGRTVIYAKQQLTRKDQLIAAKRLLEGAG